jgi:hypothetical protein
VIAPDDEGNEPAAHRLRSVAAVLIAAADRYLDGAPEDMSPAEHARMDAATQLAARACRIVRAEPPSAPRR